MKHIKKRFLIQTTSDKFNIEGDAFDTIDIDEKFNNESLKNRNGSIAFIKTKDETIIGGFVHKIEGTNLVFPIPDPTLIYFHNAQVNILAISNARTKLLKKLNYEGSISEPAINEIYNYYGVTSGFVIFLFTSIESYINQIIPSDFVYKSIQKHKTEFYDKTQIQEYLDFKTKLTSVLKQATGKDFFKNSTPTNQLIYNLKTFRDDIIHTKEDKNPLKYDHIIKTSLSFKYSETLAAVAKFMNFYSANYIEECDCGNDF